jgi:hypothetical protein
MISLEKMKVYEKFGGDMDGAQRTNDKVALEMGRSGDWKVIGDALQRWTIVSHGVASEEFQVETRKLLGENFEKAAWEYLVRMAK